MELLIQILNKNGLKQIGLELLLLLFQKRVKNVRSQPKLVLPGAVMLQRP